MKLWFCYKKVFWKKKLNCNCSLLLFSKSHFVLCTTKYTFKESLKKLICYCPSHYTVHLFNYYVHGQLTSHFIPPTGIDSKKISGSFFWDQNQDMSSRSFRPKKASDWLIYHIYQFGSKPLELMSWIGFQKKLTLAFFTTFLVKIRK